jgi:hypothetical protein
VTQNLRDYGCSPAAPALINSPPRIPDRSFDVGIAEQHSVTLRHSALAAQRDAAILRDLFDIPATRL